MKQLTLIEQCQQQPELFQFFQAVRLFYSCVAENGEMAATMAPVPVGYIFKPCLESVRFKGHATLMFVASELANNLVAPINSRQNFLRINFLSLYGAGGLLPRHYTETIITRLQVKDSALRDFLDLFNHRMLSLFYRSWEKHNCCVQFEAARRCRQTDLLTKILAASIGEDSTRIATANSMPLDAVLFYAGLFAQKPRSATVLSFILADYFQVEVSIKQFQGKWLIISRSECTHLSAGQQFNQLGHATVLGQRSWDIQNHFKIKLGPLTLTQFNNFLPNGTLLTSLMACVRHYLNNHLSFDIQLILKAAEVPACHLAATQHLGWNTWLNTAVCNRDVADTYIRG